MNREQAINAYRRTKKWADGQQARLRKQILVPHFGGMENCLTNWMLCYEDNGTVLTPETYKLAKYYLWKQNQIWDTSDRLLSHFAKYF